LDNPDHQIKANIRNRRLESGNYCNNSNVPITQRAEGEDMDRPVLFRGRKPHGNSRLETLIKRSILQQESLFQLSCVDSTARNASSVFVTAGILLHIHPDVHMERLNNLS
jgi:hypothetical protein